MYVLLQKATNYSYGSIHRDSAEYDILSGVSIEALLDLWEDLCPGGL